MDIPELRFLIFPDTLENLPVLFIRMLLRKISRKESKDSLFIYATMLSLQNRQAEPWLTHCEDSHMAIYNPVTHVEKMQVTNLSPWLHLSRAAV